MFLITNNFNSFYMLLFRASLFFSAGCMSVLVIHISNTSYICVFKNKLKESNTYYLQSFLSHYTHFTILAHISCTTIQTQSFVISVPIIVQLSPYLYYHCYLPSHFSIVLFGPYIFVFDHQNL